MAALMVHAPVPRGSGVEVLHRSLAQGIPGYRLRPYAPRWSLLPPALATFSSADAGLVHASADYGIFFKRPAVPLIATVHNYTSDRFMRPYASLLQYLHYRVDLRLFSRLTLQVATAVVAISRFMADIIKTDLGVDRQVHTIYNGIDHRQFVPPRNRRPNKRFRVLFCGNLNRRKRAQLLAPLANALGDGFEIYYTAGLSDSKLRGVALRADAAPMHALGRISHAQMPAVYHHVDVLFMPSVREGFGLCVAEAMASGLPVVACMESALPELVVHERGGYLCPIDDLECYARAVRALAEGPLMVRQMAEFNRSRVEQLFTLERMIVEYRRLFEQVLDSEPSA